MKKTIVCISLLALTLSMGIAEAEVPPNQVYYKNQGYPQLVQANKDLANSLSQEINQDDKKRYLDIATFFIAQVLKKHPDYIAMYAKNFSMLSFYEKAIFLRGIRSAGIKHELLSSISDKKMMELVNDPDLITLSDLSHLQPKEGGDLDFFWVSFFATGDEIYIRKIVEILNRDDEILFVAYEWLNREQMAEMLSSLGEKTSPNYSDLQKHIEMQSKKRKDYRSQVSIGVAALWSLDANARQDPTIAQIIQKIIKDDPSLDYWKKITKALKS